MFSGYVSGREGLWPGTDLPHPHSWRDIVLGKMAYKARVRRVIKSAKSQTVAGNVAKGLRGTCQRVVAAKGAAVKG